MNTAVLGKTMEKLKNRIEARLTSNKEDYLNWTSKPSFISKKIYDNDSVTIHKSRVTLKLNKPANV